MKIHRKIGFADFQEDDIQLPGFYTNIPPSKGGEGNGSFPRREEGRFEGLKKIYVGRMVYGKVG